MKDLFEVINCCSAIQEIKEELSKGKSILVESLSSPGKALFATLAEQATNKSLLILTGASSEEFQLYNDLPLFTNRRLIELPAWETLPSENIAPSPDIVGARFRALKEMNEEKQPMIVLSTLQGVLQKLIPRHSFEKLALTIATNDKIGFSPLIEKISKMGYERKTIVSDKGEYAVRGGIIDIFPVTCVEAYRIEFWGDEVDSIRAFDIASQKSNQVVSKITLTLSKELEEIQTTKEKLETIFDYLGDNLIVVFDDLEALEDRYANLTSLGARAGDYFLGIEEFLNYSNQFQKIFFTKQEIETLCQVTTEEKLRFYSKGVKSHTIGFEIFQRHYEMNRWQHPFEEVGTFVQDKLDLDEPLEGDGLLACINDLPSKELFYIAQTEQEETSLNKRLMSLGKPPSDHFLKGYLSSGLVIASNNIILFPMTQLTHRLKIRRERQRNTSHFTATDAFDVIPGEPVVHFNYGIGKFIGIEKKMNHLGNTEEFFTIEYADKARMFVPLTQANLVTKYIGASTELPKLHQIGTNKWKKQREHTEKSILGYASELLKLYAERELHGGFSVIEDGPETKAFDEEFPYIETEDQLKAIADVKNDMCSKKAMDRLVCGDVGYGKTEVALRAAFKAVMDGKKQVAMLVPTTVLAMQHYENFVDRMSSFGIVVGSLSRFNKPKEIKATIAGIKEGRVDIAVGTHRILQKDVIFKDLGLLIIDEEQRFGVKDKEHLKKFKACVDCLTLTATPIPRTLYMSLVGARDLSIVATPPQDRLPIKTVISEPDDNLVKTALLRELSRDGQAFFIHNRVETIFDVASRLKDMLPKARIAVAHGQMHSEEIDLVFHAFKRGEVDILVATSIVESGIDIPNANTIIIDNAQQFGVSDLYQLRGRVGRWNRRAYAYFMLPKNRSLSEIAKKRMEAIALAGGYGGGMKVAMRDLEMRGTGDILGVEQSGHVSEIGFHLYCKLLKRTVDSLQGKAPSWTIDTKVEIPFDAKLDDSYVNDVTLRMELYQKLGDALSLEEVDALFNEIKDRFGKLPERAQALYHLSRIRVFASQHGFTSIKADTITVSYEKKSGNEIHSNKVLLGKIKSAKELEQKLFQLLENVSNAK